MTPDHITDIAAAMQDAARLNARIAELEAALRGLVDVAEWTNVDVWKAVQIANAALNGAQS